VIISAPSGCGKTTIVDRLLKRHPEWTRSISMTTRPPRSGEKEGQDYYFVTAKAFKDMDAKGELLESAKVYDCFYGTPKKFVMQALAEGKKVILAIDVQGAKKVKKTMGEDAPLLSIFILPPSVKVLRERLEGRKTESAEEIQRRIEGAQDEIKEAGSYDLAFVNQNLEQTVLEMEEGIEKFQKERKGA
jgi:guanylate kinase